VNEKENPRPATSSTAMVFGTFPKQFGSIDCAKPVLIFLMWRQLFRFVANFSRKMYYHR
jgi:hypothetical protein